MSDSLRPQALSRPWDSPGKNAEVEWVAISSSGGSSRLRDQTRVSYISGTVRQAPYAAATWEALGHVRFERVSHVASRGQCQPNPDSRDSKSFPVTSVVKDAPANT